MDKKATIIDVFQYKGKGIRDFKSKQGKLYPFHITLDNKDSGIVFSYNEAIYDHKINTKISYTTTDHVTKDGREIYTITNVKAINNG